MAVPPASAPVHAVPLDIGSNDPGFTLNTLHYIGFQRISRSKILRELTCLTGLVCLLQANCASTMGLSGKLDIFHENSSFWAFLCGMNVNGDVPR